jgi:hypothetical protein
MNRSPDVRLPASAFFGGMIDGQSRALSGHRSKAYEGYAKATGALAANWA